METNTVCIMDLKMIVLIKSLYKYSYHFHFTILSDFMQCKVKYFYKMYKAESMDIKTVS